MRVFFLEINRVKVLPVDRPVETTWVLRLEDWRAQVPSGRTTTTKTGSVPFLLASQLEIDLTRTSVPVS
jgi:hypothetical protein